MSSYQNGSSNNSSASNASGGGSGNPDSKKEEFRRYLEKTNVMDSLTKVLVGLFEEPERPSNALDYIRRYLGAPPNVDVEALKKENEELKAQVEKLKQQLDDRKHKRAQA